MHVLITLLYSTLLFALTTVSASANNLSLTESDLVPIHQSVWVAPKLVIPEPDEGQPILGPSARQDGAKFLRFLSGSSEINGFSGIVYDNRDRGHSVLDPKVFPGLARLQYAANLAARELDVGLAGRTLIPAVVLGNSSMAMRQGPLRRSLPRLAMTNPFWREVTPVLYANNHIYVYPEHRDYDSADLLPINWPYMIISEGSSGSDKAFLGAVAMTLAAFPTDTFAEMRKQGLVAPTIQMILRRNLSSVTSREDYLSGAAHPPVFNGKQIRAGRMVGQAAEMRPAEIPPLVRLRVTQDDFIPEAGLADLDERLLDSPAAIGRLWRDYAWEKTLTVTAEDTVAPNLQPLSFEWRILQGDPDLIRIKPDGPGGRSAQITIAWHDPWTLSTPQRNGTVERRVSRVDIGVFANNGLHDSAPAIISIDFPDHQQRKYGEAAGGKQLTSIDYAAKERGVYFDPVIYWSAPWTDVARYDESGALLGWDRSYKNGETAFVALADDKLEHATNQANGSAPSTDK